jgi:HEPN domain-containing protein
MINLLPGVMISFFSSGGSRWYLKPPLYEFVSKLNNASVMTRYPSDMQAALRDYTRDIAASYLEQTEEVLEWLRSDPRLRE